VKLTLSVAMVCALAVASCSDDRRPGDPATGGGDQPADNWVQVTSAEGHFTAWFPAEPKHTLPAGDLIHRYVAETQQRTVAFSIRYTPQADVKISLDERLASVRAAVKSTNAAVTSVTVCGFPAREMSHEYVYDGMRWSSRHRIFYNDPIRH
jgi:hypothetical protein